MRLQSIKCYISRDVCLVEGEFSFQTSSSLNCIDIKSNSQFFTSPFHNFMTADNDSYIVPVINPSHNSKNTQPYVNPQSSSSDGFFLFLL